MKRFIAWLVGIWNKLFGKKVANFANSPKPYGGIYGDVPDRGKEDAHTKIKKKMAYESRRINRAYKRHSNGKK